VGREAHLAGGGISPVRRLLRRGLTFAAVAVLVMLPSAAGAERRGEHDALADVWASPVGAVSYTAVPKHVDGDIVATRVIHAPRAVWIRVRFRELTDTTNGNFHRFAIKSDRRYRFVEINALPGHWEGTALMTGSAGRPVACALHFRIDYVLNQIHLKIPRSCLSKPSWVRVGVRSIVAGALRVFTDDGHSIGVPGRIALGRRVWH